MRRYRIGLALLLASGSLVVASFAAAQQGGSAIRGRITDQQQGMLPGVSIVITHAENGTIRETVTGADGTYLVPGLVPGPYKIAAQLQGFSRLTQENLVVRVGATLQVDLVAAGRRRSRRTSPSRPNRRRSISPPRRSAATCRRARSKTCHPARATSPAWWRCCPASSTTGGRLLVGQRHDQRPARQRRRVSDGRRQQQRRPARRQLGRAGAAAARSDPGVPGRHQPVRRRVRRRHRRRRQRRDQAGHQPWHGSAIGYFTDSSMTAKDFFVDAAEPGQARHAQEAVGRHDRRADRPRQDAFLRQLRAPGSRRRPQPRLPDAAGQELHASRRRPTRANYMGRVDHQLNSEQQLLGPLPLGSPAELQPGARQRHASTR